MAVSGGLGWGQHVSEVLFGAAGAVAFLWQGLVLEPGHAGGGGLCAGRRGVPPWPSSAGFARVVSFDGDGCLALALGVGRTRASHESQYTGGLACGGTLGVHSSLGLFRFGVVFLPRWARPGPLGVLGSCVDLLFGGGGFWRASALLILGDFNDPSQMFFPFC